MNIIDKIDTYLNEGYTHYWKGKFTDDEWKEIINGTKQIIKKAEAKKIKIMGPDGTGKPVISSTEISFNGDEENGKDYETFELLKNGKSAFCKTNEKPYDKVVVSVLALAKEIHTDFDVRSDGGKKAIKRVF